MWVLLTAAIAVAVPPEVFAQPFDGPMWRGSCLRSGRSSGSVSCDREIRRFDFFGSIATPSDVRLYATNVCNHLAFVVGDLSPWRGAILRRLRGAIGCGR